MNNSLKLQIAILCLILAIANTQSNTTQANITFAPPPPINTSTLTVFNNSNNDGRFIGSKRLQTLQCNSFVVNNVTSTNFRIVSFDRNAPNNVRVAQFNQTGNWQVIKQTRDSLSCFLVMNTVTPNFGDPNFFGFLQFTNNNLRMLYFSNVTLNGNIAGNIELKQNCYAHVSGSLSVVNTSGIFPIQTPANWNYTSTSQSINYGIANNQLYKFNPNTLSYTSVYTFPPNSNYDIRSNQGNLIIAASNVTASPPQISQAFFIFTDQNSTLSLISQFTISGKNLANSTFIPYLTSPQLSKLGINFVPANSTNNTNQVSIFKTINFAKKTIGDLKFKQPSRFLATTLNIPPGNSDFAFGDNYYIVRNGTGVNTTANQSFVEQAYQFVGDQVIFLRNRVLSGKEFTNFSRTSIDTSYQNQLVILNTYVVNGGIQVEQFAYGNLVSINRILPTVTPPFITFTVPTNNFNFVVKNSFSWNYLDSGVNSTNLTIINANTNFANNIQVIHSSLPGNQKILAMNDKCLILKQAASGNINIARPPANVNSSTNVSSVYTLQDVTQVLTSSNTTTTNNSNWIVSSLCDRFAVDNKVFTRTSNQSFIPLPIPQLPSSLNQNLNFAVIGNDIWSLVNNSFVLALNNSALLSQSNGNNTTNGTNTTNVTSGPLPPPLLPMNKIYSANNLIVITATNNTAAQVYAYSVGVNGMIRPLLNFYFPAYQSTPKILVSSNLTKVLIMGPFLPPNKTQSEPKIDSFFIDSPNNGFQNITLPFNTIPDPVNSFVLLDDQYLYIRSLTTNFTNSPNGTQPQQNIYFINQDVVPQIAYSVNLTQDQVNTFKRVIFNLKTDGSINVFVESLNGTQVIVTKLQTSGKQANLNQNSNILGVTAMISDDGSVRLCAPGCISCATGTCPGCTTSWVFDSSSYICYRCGQNCASCSLSNTLQCLSCLSGSFLTVNATCLKCQGCKQCSGSATNCTGCPPSKVFLNGTCNNNCTRNCIFCSDQSKCQTCAKGFVLNNGTCRGCAMSCSNCSSTNITQCTSCAPGLSLVNSTCIQCPDKCQACNNGICATCIPGFTPNTAGLCVLSCNIKCATCVDNQPTVCLSCYDGGVLSNGTCVLNATCNTDSTCSHCGQGLGYVLSGTNCIQCQTNSNCLQCSATNTANCSICLNGYYIDTSDYSCQACSTGCLLCSSADICSACAIGYTLPENSTQGQCLQCQSPCAACLGISTYCLTCINGFTKRGWKCQNNTYSGFKFTLSDTPANILANIDYIVARLLLILNISSTNVDAITFNTIVSGSTVVSGTATTDDPSAATATLASSLSTGSFGTYTVTSFSVETAGVSQESKSTTNVGLIVGLVIGLTVLVVIVVIVVYYIYKKKKASQVNEGQEGHIVIQMEHDTKLKNESKHQSQNFGLHANKEIF